MTIGTSYRPPKAARMWLDRLERKVADGLAQAIARAMAERRLAEAEELERRAAQLRRMAQDTMPDERG